ncbi:MAG: ABC transporter permease, partial [Bacteriovoracia bacterium]
MTAATATVTTNVAAPKGRSLWKDASLRLRRDKFAMLCFAIIVIYAVIAILAKFGIVGAQWDQAIMKGYAPPSGESYLHWMGTDIFGRSVLLKVIHGARVAMSVGLVTCLISIPIGVTLGAIGGYFGGWIDDLVVWFYTTLASIPGIMLIVATAFALGKGMFAIYVSLGITSWVGLARVIRG